MKAAHKTNLIYVLENPYAIFVYSIYLFFCTPKTHTEYVIYFIIQIAKRFDSLNAQMPLTNDHFKHLSVTYE